MKEKGRRWCFYIFDLGPKNWRYVSHHGTATFLRKNKEYLSWKKKRMARIMKIKQAFMRSSSMNSCIYMLQQRAIGAKVISETPRGHESPTSTYSEIDNFLCYIENQI